MRVALLQHPALTGSVSAARCCSGAFTETASDPGADKWVVVENAAMIAWL